MWSPWRSAYLETFKNPPRKTKSKKSIFTQALEANDDDKYYIVWRGKYCFIILNLYPYNSGHLMIVPYRQTARFDELTDKEIGEMMKVLRRAIRALDAEVHPDGFNFGANLGRASGAGVNDHIHFHLVPSWNGDTNFMPVVSDAKVISEDMRTTMYKLRKALKQAGKKKS